MPAKAAIIQNPQVNQGRRRFLNLDLLVKVTVPLLLLFPLNLVGLKGEAAEARVTELLEYMEVADRAHYLPALLSGGSSNGWRSPGLWPTGLG